MFGLGTAEIIVVVIVALILINPKDLPGLVRKGGRIYGKLMREINGVRKNFSQFEEEVKFLAEIEESDLTKTRRKK